MRLAIIDLGTNSVRFDVVEVAEGGQILKLHREKLMIRLGDKVFLRKRLDPHAIGVCIDAFRSFKSTLEDFHVKRVIAFGTAALREARDGARLIEKIKRQTGITVRIISGDEEARLIAKGVLKNESSLRGRFALVDIGGGSTEVTICSGRKVLRSGSFLLGTARLQQIFLKTIPPALGVKEKSNPIENLRRNIRGVLLYRLVSEEWPKVSRIIGSSGTIRALVKISKKETGSEVIQREYLDHLVTRMIKMSRAELAAIPGMEPRRVDMILAGAILLQECMNAVHASRAELTEFSLRDGILDEQMELLKSQKKEKNIHLVHDFILAAKRLGANEAELHQAIKISETLFDLLKPVHKLTFEWKVYLTIASILQGSGKAISSIEYENHSAYISKNLDIVGLSDLERRLISELCIQHRNGRILKKEAPFKKNKKLQRGFFKLLALLRLSGALSLQRAKPIKIEKVSFKGKIVKILISKRYAPDLEILRAEQKKQLFEEVFRRQLILELV